MTRNAGALDRPIEVALEMLEPEPLRIDEATVEGSANQNRQFAQAEHRNGTLPALPDIAAGLRLNLVEGVTEKSRRVGAVDRAPKDQHGERVAHPRPNEFVGLGVQNDRVERLWVAVAHRCHDAVA